MKRLSTPQDKKLLSLSIGIQLVLAFFLGHAYDIRIFMATGYLVGTGQNPYLAQDLSLIFHNNSFRGITSFGYPPPWSLILGLIYFCTYRNVPNFLLYNLAIKVPIIAANVGLAYLVTHIMNKFGVEENILRKAWAFLLFNPFLLCTSSAWGQFDSAVALFSLLSILLLWEGKLVIPGILLALAISLKPTAIPLTLVVFIYLSGISAKRTFLFFAVFTVSMILFCVAPFILLGWNPTIILQHWNAHFTTGGGLSFMTFLEYTEWSYQLPGQWWFLGWGWIPALGLAAYAMKGKINRFEDLLRMSVAAVLVFFLCRSWLSETNINLILPFVVILASTNIVDQYALTTIWCLPLLFSIFNLSIPQLFFPSMPGVMSSIIKLADEYTNMRYEIRTLIVIIWLGAGWLLVLHCFRKPEEI